MPLSFLTTFSPRVRSRAFAPESYGADGRETLQVIAPAGADGEAPVVVVLPPTGAGLGERLRRAAVSRGLASRGLVVLTASVPSPQDDLGRSIEQAARACAWAQAHAGDYGGDPARVFVFGEGDGAGVAAMLALDPIWLKSVGAKGGLRGVVGVQGLYDLAPLHATERSREEAAPMLLIAGSDGGEEARSTGWLARALRGVGGSVAEIRLPRARLRGLGLGRPLLEEVERFIRLRSLEPAL